jgi:hypothetical protein
MRDLPRIAFGVCDLFTSALVVTGVFVGLPARWVVVDASAAIVATLLAVAGVGLLLDRAWAKDVARFASFAVLVVAALAIGAMATGIAYLRAIHGPVGKGGSVVFTMVLALVAPYLVVLPSLQLLWLGARPRREKPSS